MITEKSFHCPSEARTHDLPIPLSITVGRCNQLSHGARIQLPNEEIYQPKNHRPDLASRLDDYSLHNLFKHWHDVAHSDERHQVTTVTTKRPVLVLRWFCSGQLSAISI